MSIIAAPNTHHIIRIVYTAMGRCINTVITNNKCNIFTIAFDQSRNSTNNSLEEFFFPLHTHLTCLNVQDWPIFLHKHFFVFFFLVYKTLPWGYLVYRFFFKCNKIMEKMENLIFYLLLRKMSKNRGNRVNNWYYHHSCRSVITLRLVQIRCICAKYRLRRWIDEMRRIEFLARTATADIFSDRLTLQTNTHTEHTFALFILFT